MTRPDPSGTARVAALEATERDACADLWAAAPDPVRSAFGLAHRAVGDGVLLIASGLEGMVFNRLLGYGAAAEPGGEALDGVLADFGRAGVSGVVQVAPTAAGLAALAARRGLEPHPRSWVRFARGPEPAASVPSGLSVRAAGPEAAGDFGRVVCASFGLPGELAPWFSALVGRPGWLAFLAWDGSEPAGAGALFFTGERAWLGLGGTLAAHRRRGAQAALLAARIEAARARGVHELVTETGRPLPGEPAPSFRNIERAGFRQVYDRPNLRRPPP